VRQFRSQSGLYIIGAGASVGDAPRGQSFMAGPALDYVRGGSFPVSIPEQSELNERIITAAQRVSLADVFPDREIRPGTDGFPFLEMAQRLPIYYGRTRMKHVLSRARYSGCKPHSYRVFERFRHGLIANYNHDGLARDLCAPFHDVVDMHVVVEPGYGSPEMAAFLERARDYDFPLEPDRLLMCVPESFQDAALLHRLLRIARFRPSFIAVIGYSFGRNTTGFDDMVSLDFFSRAFRDFRGNVYVIEPWPRDTSEMLAERIRANGVFGIPAFWNVLAHSIVRAADGSNRSLNHTCQALLDRLGSERSFPLDA
jgi:hypothetical protein